MHVNVHVRLDSHERAILAAALRSIRVAYPDPDHPDALDLLRASSPAVTHLDLKTLQAALDAVATLHRACREQADNEAWAHLEQLAPAATAWRSAGRPSSPAPAPLVHDPQVVVDTLIACRTIQMREAQAALTVLSAAAAAACNVHIDHV